MTPAIRRLDDTAAVLVLSGLVLAWLGRAGGAFDVPTTFASYAEYPLVGLGFVAVLLGSGRSLRPRWLLLGGAAFAAVAVVSALIHGLPLALAGVGAMLYLEPFLAVFVLVNVSTPWLRGAALRVIGAILVIQVPFVIGQWIVLGAGDPVQGTLVGSGAGAHVLGYGLLVGVAVLLAGPRRFHPVVLSLVALAVAGMVVADAKQVWALIPLVLAVMYIKGAASARSDSGRDRRSIRPLLAGAAVFVLLAVPVAYLLGQTYVGRVAELTVESHGGKVAVTQTLVRDVSSSASSATWGFGPGETVSRLAWMRSPEGGIETSVLQHLGIGESEWAMRYHRAATSRGFVGLSSVSFPLSSLLGILGDYGVVGCLIYAVLMGGLLRSLARSRDPLAGAALGLWLGLILLAVISDWLEQTPITLMVAVVSGLALAAGGKDVEGRGTSRAPAAGEAAP